MENPAPQSSRRDAILSAFLFAACVLVAYPVSAEGYLDDFSYAKTALEFARTGHIVYNAWASPMQGWQILWGALFIKLFGFSFTVLRMSILPFVAASVYLFHRILSRFGIGRRNAFFGAMTLALSPLFFSLANSFMTDLSGLFVILLCINMCQHAVTAKNDRATQWWLLSAAMLSLVGGTVRQTAWLGALVIVPSTGWLLRKRRGALIASLAAAAVSCVGALACMRWLTHQPYVFPEPTLRPGLLHLYMATYLLHQIGIAFLFLMFLLLPAIAAWLPATRTWSKWAFARIVLLLLIVAICLRHAARIGHLPNWTAPWLTTIVAKGGIPPIDQLFGSSVTLSGGLRLAMTYLVIAAAFVMMEQIFGGIRSGRFSGIAESAFFRRPFWICGPFSFAYILLHLPRIALTGIYDRYLLALLPMAIIALLLVYQRLQGDIVPWIARAVLILYAIYAVGGTHDFYADERAGDRAVQELQASGVPRTQISQSFAANGWLQLDVDQRINMPGTPSPSMETKPPAQQWIVPDPSCSDGFAGYTPVLKAKYYLVVSPGSCLAPTTFPPVPYTAWLPPFHRRISIQQTQQETP